MLEPAPLLAVFAHPDDESIVAGGTLARNAQAGMQTALLCATRGEWGPISDEALADYENLGAVRERELRAACEVLGVGWLRFLDLEDGAVAAVLGGAEEEQTLDKIVRAIRELRPQTVITFGPDGLYGHPDHIAIGQLTTKACGLSGDPTAFPHQLRENLAPHYVPELYYATVPHGYYTCLVAQLANSGYETHLWGIPPEQFGIPQTEINVVLDITSFLECKLAALRCHRTQLDAAHTFTLFDDELAFRFLGQEFFYSQSALRG